MVALSPKDGSKFCDTQYRIFDFDQITQYVNGLQHRDLSHVIAQFVPLRGTY